MRSSANGQRRIPAIARSETSASLSVVVVSSGSPIVAQKAAQALKSASRGIVAQFIVVSQEEDPALASTVERAGAEFVRAPKGSSRALMCDLGMSQATGVIVAVRDDDAVGDAAWLNTYRAILPRTQVTPVTSSESLVLDSMVAVTAELADVAAPKASEARPAPASIEIAAAV